MNIDIVTQYILALVPAVTAVVGMVVTIGVGINKIKKANADTVDHIERDQKARKSTTDKVLLENAELKKENAELKRTLRKVLGKLEHVKIVDKEE